MTSDGLMVYFHCPTPIPRPIPRPMQMGTVPNDIGLCTHIGLGVGSVETVLYITTEAIDIGLGLCLGIGIGLGQWKHTINMGMALTLVRDTAV